MKTLRIVCPTCGAHLDVDIDSGQARCRFCDEIFSLDTRKRASQPAPDPDMSSAEQMGYDFERGRQRAGVEFAQGYSDRIDEERARQEQQAYYVPEAYYEPAPALSRPDIPLWAWVVMWLFFPPVAIGILIFRSARLEQSMKLMLVIIVALAYLSMVIW